MSSTRPASHRVRLRHLAVTALLLACAGDRPAWARGLDDPAALRAAEADFRAGRYEQALEAYRRLASAADAGAAARQGLIRTLTELGRYDEAGTEGRRLAGPRPAVVARELGRAAQERGRLDEADSLYSAAVAGAAPDSLAALADLAALRWSRGRREEALRTFDRFVDIYNERRGRLTSQELAAVGDACVHLGTVRQEMFRDALRAYAEAIAADSTDPEPRLELGELFLAKFNSGEAKRTLDAALRLNPNHPRLLLALHARLLLSLHAGRRLPLHALRLLPLHARLLAFHALRLLAGFAFVPPRLLHALGMLTRLVEALSSACVLARRRRLALRARRPLGLHP